MTSLQRQIATESHRPRRSRGGTALLAGVLALTTVLVSAAVADEQPETSVKQRVFERVFGDAARLDPELVAKVKAMPPGKMLFVDADGDGKNDEAWFIDPNPRHTDKLRPILVRVIDEDGDLDEYGGPDLKNDLYIVSYNATGNVDVVIDYQDVNGDGGLDEMAMFFYIAKRPPSSGGVLRAWWGRDDGNDNMLWYDVDYTYYQNLCQYQCHFSGDETFVAFSLPHDGDRWLASWENPFLFYDLDGDRCSEVTLRIEGRNDKVRAIRYSFDADDDAYGRRPYNYDFSITAYADPNHLLHLPPEVLESTSLRGLPTQPWLKRNAAEQAAIEADVWIRAKLTWDEMNANTEAGVDRDPNERWEGIIAHGSENFKPVGGPSTSPHNKRYEVSLEPIAPMRLYLDETDHRLHLFGAKDGWINVDFDYDGSIDAWYTWVDENGDGRFDRRRLDLDNDGTVDFDWPTQAGTVREVPLDWETIKDLYVPLLDRVLADSQQFIDAAKVALDNPPPDPTERFFLKELDDWYREAGLGPYMRKSPAGARFYVDFVRDRLLLALKNKFGTHDAWNELEKTYASGDYAAAADIVTRALADRPIPSGASFRAFSHRIPVRIDNTGHPRRLDWPIAIPLARIREAAPDFNPNCCAVVAPQRWLDWRAIAHQIDTVEPWTGPELSFLIDLPDDGAHTFYLYYSPEGSCLPDFEARTATAEDWIPPNIGWESLRTAYRMYWGQWDFFGKKTNTLIYPTIGQESYHSETDWGIDALHVGKGPGIGGLTLYLDDEPYLVRNPAGKGDVAFTKRQLVAGPVRAAIEVTAHNVVPSQPDLTVHTHCLIYDEREETEVRVAVTDAEGNVVLAPGLSKLVREDFFALPEQGCVGVWGWQEEAISDIGMGFIVDPGRFVDVVDLPEERQVRCRLEDGRLRFWVIGDWRRGRQHPIAPNVDNWRVEMSELADHLTSAARVEIGEPEEAR